MALRIVRGRVTSGRGRSSGVPGLRVELWLSAGEGERRVAQAVTDHQGGFRSELDEELNGVCTFTGGTGEFTHFHATFTVTYLGDVDWHWEGPYSFEPSR